MNTSEIIPSTTSANQTNTNQKRGDLTGGALTLEVIESSKSVLHRTRSGDIKGTQSFFTPPALAEFIKEVLDPGDRFHVLDLTAGDGSLLAPYASQHRIGVEIDADQIRAAKQGKRPYAGLHGDVQRLFPLLRLAAVQVERVVLNPPFGLAWEVQGKPMNSQKATLVMALALLSPGGQGAMIGGTNRIKEDILGDPALAPAVYAVVELPPLFPGVSLPTSVLFFSHPCTRRTGKKNAPAKVIQASDDLAAALPAVKQARQEMTEKLSQWDSVFHDQMVQDFRQVAQEHSRRRAQKEGKQAADICLKGKKISINLSALTVKALLDAGKSPVNISGLDGKRVNYFALNGRQWQEVNESAKANLLTLDKGLAVSVQAVIDEATTLACPVYPIRPQQRLGYLADAGQIECTASDDKKGFVAGQFYGVKTSSRIAQSERRETKEVTTEAGGKELKELTWIRKAKVLDIILDPGPGRRPHTLSETKEDIDYLLAHFAVPDPGDLATRFPAEMEQRRETLRQIERDILGPQGEKDLSPQNEGRPYSLKPFQRDDVSRLLMKQGGPLNTEQGGGKTLQAMTFAEAAHRRGETDGNALFVVPQDLIGQWQGEATKFFGRRLIRIRTRTEARAVAEAIKAEREAVRLDPWHEAAPKWYITNYEALSLTGTSGKAEVVQEGERQSVRAQRGSVTLPPVPVRTVLKPKVIPAGYRDDGDGFRWHETETKSVRVSQDSQQLCPQCWQQGGGHGAGYTKAGNQIIKRLSKQGFCLPQDRDALAKEYHAATFAKNSLTTSEDKTITGKKAWDGVSCRECGMTLKALTLKNMAHEITTAFIQGCIFIDEATKIKGDSLQSYAVRGLRARRKIVMTGTPVKNIVLDVFHLLGWSCGYNSPRFPFPYGEGYEQFKKDFCVVEYLAGKKSREKVLPEVTNLSVLWRLLSSAVVRRRKEDMGEPLVSRKFVPVTVPMGTAQRKQYGRWLYDFPDFYCDKNPQADYSYAAMNSFMLGMGHKLEFTTTLPSADPDRDYFRVPGLSDMTPKSLKVLEILAFHAARGEKVLYGSFVKMKGKFVADALTARGIPAAHILDEARDGTMTTKSPAARASVISKFRDGDTRVLCASVQSVNMGHNLDFANIVVLDGLPWDFGTMDQFLARVHRLSSTRPVTVYVVMAEGSMDERKWDLLQRKMKGAELTLDGQLTEKETEAVNLQAILKEMIARGLPEADTIDEADCTRLWSERQYTLLPIGSEISADALPDTLKPAETKPQPKQDTLFTFETVQPKKKAAALHIPQPVIQQGSLFAL